MKLNLRVILCLIQEENVLEYLSKLFSVKLTALGKSRKIILQHSCTFVLFAACFSTSK